MARTVEIISTVSGTHHILLGWNASEIADFSLQTYITKFGARSVDFVQSLSQGFISFMGGDLWIHNSNNVPRANLFGEQKDVKVGIVANQEPNIVKLLDSIGIQTDGSWEIESVTIPKSMNQPHGQYSTIPKERFKRREGVLQSEFLRNGKTTDGNVSVIEMIRGESLRGSSAYLVLKKTDSVETKLYKVSILMTKSR
jgi:hypothetical protein